MPDPVKERALARVRDAHAEATAFFGGLPAQHLDHPVFGEGEGWRIRDLIPHLALWWSVSTRVAEKVAATDTLPDTADWDVWAGELTPTPELNDRTFREWRERSLDDRLARLETAHERLIAALERLRGDQIATGERLEEMHEFVVQPGVRHPRTHVTHAQAALEPRSEAKQAFLREAERAHHDAAMKLRALSATQLDHPIFDEGMGWKVRDVVANLAVWYRVGARTARKLAWYGAAPDRGMRAYLALPDETLDDFNARETAKWRGRSHDDVLAELDKAYAAFDDALRVLPAARIVDAAGKPHLSFWVTGIEHLRQHMEHVDLALR